MKKMLAVCLLMTSFLFGSEGLAKIDYVEAKKLYDSGNALFVDARGLKLYQKGTIMKSMMVPVTKYDKYKKFLPGNKSVAMVVFCNGYECEKSDDLAKKMIADGYKHVMVYPGGAPEWKEKKYPMMGVMRAGAKPAAAAQNDAAMKTLYGVSMKPGLDTGSVDSDWFMAAMGNLPKGLTLVDVRGADKSKSGMIKGAISVPFDGDSSTLDETKVPKEGLIVLYCNTGAMSADARLYLTKKGWKEDQVWVFDANVECQGTNCKIEPNEQLGL